MKKMVHFYLLLFFVYFFWYLRPNNTRKNIQKIQRIERALIIILTAYFRDAQLVSGASSKQQTSVSK